MSEKKLQTPQELKDKLEALKASKPGEWTDELQAKLDEVTKVLEPKFTPKKGQEGNVIIEVYKGQRFDPETGKETAVKWTMNMTKPEWDQFKQFSASVGLKVSKVIYDPYNEAKGLVKE